MDWRLASAKTSPPAKKPHHRSAITTRCCQQGQPLASWATGNREEAEMQLQNIPRPISLVETARDGHARFVSTRTPLHAWARAKVARETFSPGVPSDFRRFRPAKLNPTAETPLERPAPHPMYHPIGWNLDGARMAGNVQELRPKAADTEKITINLGYVDLGRIDLMVQEGFYSNRTDFIRTAVRNQLERHAEVVKQSTARKSLELGLRHYTRDHLETVRAAGEMLQIQVLGLASIAMDVTPELARAAIASVSVLGALHASAAVQAALADKMV